MVLPELPEVETIRRGLQRQVSGRLIEDVVVDGSRVLRADPQEFSDNIRGQRIRALDRRGKNLVFRLDRHDFIIHLGMTGQLTFRDPAREDSERFIRHPVTGLQRIDQHAPDRHTHMQVLFEDGSSMLYRDIRMFGKIHLFGRGTPALSSFLARLGMEPLTEAYSFRAFVSRLGRRKLRVKSLLLDQGFVAGIGNIYADEALFEAGIHPERRVNQLTKSDQKRLYDAIPRVLEKGIHFGGTSLRDYINSQGETGSNQENLMAYGRGGEKCRICDRRIEKIVVGQRGTHFCPGCQPAAGSGSR